jgi:hypothetical protein
MIDETNSYDLVQYYEKHKDELNDSFYIGHGIQWPSVIRVKFPNIHKDYDKSRIQVKQILRRFMKKYGVEDLLPKHIKFGNFDFSDLDDAFKIVLGKILYTEYMNSINQQITDDIKKEDDYERYLELLKNRDIMTDDEWYDLEDQ